ncbi:MAG: XrtA/PEP-CTERM system histidine kinase PrsK, partial [Burkholderiaceae bacterium]
HRLSPEAWTARGFANALAAPLIGFSIARSPAWLSGIAISRRILFHSATLIGSAIYLLLVGVAGYYLKFFGGQWGSVLQVFLIFIAATFLAAVLFSGAFRSWLKVSISKHFYHYGYDYREEWLKFTRMLSVEGPELGERTIQAIAELVESTKGMLFLENGADYAAASSWNMPLARASLPGDDALCEFLKRTRWVVDLNEYEAHPERYQYLALAPSRFCVPDAWLVVPLMQAEALFGFVVLSQARSRVGLNWEVRDLLKIAGSQAASYLAKEKSAEALATVRQFDAFNRMSTFVVHDLKNVVSQLALLAANAERHRENREFQQDMIDTIQHAARKMQGLLQKFSHGADADHTGRAALSELLQRVVGSKKMLTPRPVLDLGDAQAVVPADAARLERVIGHLIQNAIEATPPEGEVRVTLAATADEAIVQVADTGRGMSQDFIMAHLFQPFHSTKSSGMGIGVYEARDYLLQVGGRLDVESTPGQGTTFRVTLPRLNEAFEDEANAA